MADSLSRSPQSAMHVRLYNQDSDYVYTSELDAEDSESDYSDSCSEDELVGSSTLDEANE